MALGELIDLLKSIPNEEVTPTFAIDLIVTRAHVTIEDAQSTLMTAFAVGTLDITSGYKIKIPTIASR